MVNTYLSNRTIERLYGFSEAGQFASRYLANDDGIYSDTVPVVDTQRRVLLAHSYPVRSKKYLFKFPFFSLGIFLFP